MIEITLIGLIIFLLILLSLILFDEKRQRKDNTLRVKSGKIWHGEDRRQFARINTEIGVRYEILRNKFKPTQTNSRDISLGGVNLALAEKFSKGVQLKMEIDLPSSKRSLSLRGEVIWSKEIANSIEKFGKKIFATGIKFKKIDLNDQLALNKFIEGAISQEESNIQ